MIFTLLENLCAAYNNTLSDSFEIILPEYKNPKVSSFSGLKIVLKRAFIKNIVEIQTDSGKIMEIDLNQNTHDFLVDLSKNAFQIRKNKNLLKAFSLNYLKKHHRK